MTEPTDADRKHAAELIYHNLPGDQVEAVARALAEERAKFLAVAEELDRWQANAARYAAHSDRDSATGAMARARAMTYARASETIRRAADTTP